MKSYENNKQTASPQADGTSTPEKKTNPRREELKALSKGLDSLIKEEVYSTVNEAIIDIYYKKNGHQVFNTFMEWKELGQSVKKGEKAFVLWSSPKKKAKQKAEAPEGETDEYKFFGLCYVFSNLQVEPSKNREEAENV